MRFLSLDDLLMIAERVVGAVEVRDLGLLESAAARPRTTVFGSDAYPGLHSKAAALVHSLVNNHALVDGNKRLGLASLIAFYGLNGRVLRLTNDEAHDLIIDVAMGKWDDISRLAETLENVTEPWPPSPGAAD